MSIRAARADECAVLTQLACSAKAHWGYAAEELEAWLPQLRFSAASIRQQPTFVFETEAGIVGVLQLATATRPGSIDALWVSPQAMRRGVGGALLRHALDHARRQGQDLLSIDADPHAEAFYLAFGARRVGELAAPTRAEPARVRPQLVLATHAG